MFRYMFRKILCDSENIWQILIWIICNKYLPCSRANLKSFGRYDVIQKICFCNICVKIAFEKVVYLHCIASKGVELLLRVDKSWMRHERINNQHSWVWVNTAVNILIDWSSLFTDFKTLFIAVYIIWQELYGTISWTLPASLEG